MQQHLTKLRGRGKRLLESTRATVRRYRAAQGSRRTRQIFGMSLTAKITLAIIALILLLFAFYLVKLMYLPETSPEVAEPIEKVAGAAVPLEAAANDQLREEELAQLPLSEPEPESPFPAAVTIPTLASSSFIIGEEEIAEAAKLTVLPEPVDVGNLGAACQVNIRNQEHDLASAAQFFTKAKQTYLTALNELRNPSDSLRESIEELHAEKAKLAANVEKCFGNQPEPPKQPELPEQETVPQAAEQSSSESETGQAS